MQVLHSLQDIPLKCVMMQEQCNALLRVSPRLLAVLNDLPVPRRILGANTQRVLS